MGGVVSVALPPAAAALRQSDSARVSVAAPAAAAAAAAVAEFIELSKDESRVRPSVRRLVGYELLPSSLKDGRTNERADVIIV